jgi:phosphoribosylanthranilate isomerase
MWIKICGMSSEQAVETALHQRVDAIGFVFAPSVRQLEPTRAARLALPARGRTLCVAVTLHPSQAAIDQILREFNPDVLQSDLADLAQLRLPSQLAVLPVLRAGASLPAAVASAVPPRLLFEGPRSGTGVATDWHQASSLARRTQLILAGGLTPHNVAAAIAAVRPFGVDVSSGVEAAPGQKDPRKIIEFIQAARAAFAGITHESN